MRNSIGIGVFSYLPRATLIPGWILFHLPRLRRPAPPEGLLPYHSRPGHLPRQLREHQPRAPLRSLPPSPAPPEPPVPSAPPSGLVVPSTSVESVPPLPCLLDVGSVVPAGSSAPTDFVLSAVASSTSSAIPPVLQPQRVTRLQHGIKKPKICTDGTVRLLILFTLMNLLIWSRH